MIILLKCMTSIASRCAQLGILAREIAWRLRAGIERVLVHERYEQIARVRASMQSCVAS